MTSNEHQFHINETILNLSWFEIIWYIILNLNNRILMLKIEFFIYLFSKTRTEIFSKEAESENNQIEKVIYSYKMFRYSIKHFLKTE